MLDVRENGLSTYLAEISRIPLLPPSEEIRLAKLAQKGDGAARRKLIVSNLRLVVSIAKKYLYYGMPLLDLIEEGNLGLMKAVDRYDPNRGCKFSTYATWWIRQAVTRSLSNQGRTVRIPVYITDNVARYKKISEDLYIKTGKQPELEEIAKHLGVKIQEARRLKEFVEVVAPLEKAQNTDGAEPLAVSDSVEPRQRDKAIEQIELDQQMEELMRQLTDREGNIIRYRYGLSDGMVHTLEETGKAFSLTRERIRQIEKDVMKRLRLYVASHQDDFTP
ncbi:MAG TPA: RNA polymerase sigma factor RpoD/SigA [Candidatus Hydrogenedentes bacterium]|nr:RNA polymerase sigma factor RpoD/SigA [Candidatus Hydrogenedentota bacterium]